MKDLSKLVKDEVEFSSSERSLSMQYDLTCAQEGWGGYTPMMKILPLPLIDRTLHMYECDRQGFQAIKDHWSKNPSSRTICTCVQFAKLRMSIVNSTSIIEYSNCLHQKDEEEIKQFL